MHKEMIKNRFCFLFVIILLISGCASGSGIVTGQKRSPIDPTQVKVIAQSST